MPKTWSLTNRQRSKGIVVIYYTNPRPATPRGLLELSVVFWFYKPMNRY